MNNGINSKGETKKKEWENEQSAPQLPSPMCDFITPPF